MFQKIRLLQKPPFIKKIGVFRRMREFRLRRECLNNGTTNYILDQWQSQPDNLVMLCKFLCVYRIISDIAILGSLNLRRQQIDNRDIISPE